jgi:hypothetical protein
MILITTLNLRQISFPLKHNEGEKEGLEGDRAGQEMILLGSMILMRTNPPKENPSD